MFDVNKQNEIERALREWCGRQPIGTTAPTILQIMREAGASRNTVRQVFNRLEADRTLVKKSGGGHITWSKNLGEPTREAVARVVRGGITLKDAKAKASRFSPPAWDQAVNEIRRRFQGKRGDKLPTIKELSSQLDVSSGTVRAAISYLVGTGELKQKMLGSSFVIGHLRAPR